MKKLQHTIILILFSFLLTQFNVWGDTGRVYKNMYVEHNVIKDGEHGVNVVADVELHDMAGKQVEITALLSHVVNASLKNIPSAESFRTTVPESGIIPYVSFFIPTEGLPDDLYKARLDIFDLSVVPKKRIGSHDVREFRIDNAYRTQPQLDWSNVPKITVEKNITVKVLQHGHSPVALKISKWDGKLRDTSTGNMLEAEVSLNEGLNPITINGQTRVIYCKPIYRIFNQRYNRSGNELVITFDMSRDEETYPSLFKEQVPGPGLGVWAGLYKYHLTKIVEGSKVSGSQKYIPVMTFDGNKTSGFQNFGNIASQNRQYDLQVRIPLNDIPPETLDSTLKVSLWPYIYDGSEWHDGSNVWSPTFTITELTDIDRPQPDPTPSTTKPVLTWIQCPPTTSNSQLTLKVGVKSSSAISSYRVLVNGSATRGIKAVHNDGYDMMIDPTLLLSEGNNEIRVEVTNSTGTVSESRNVTYQHSGTPDRIKTSELKKIALVVGNAAYPDQPLRNTLNDATDIALKLNELGFEVILVPDATRRTLDTSINDFGNRAGNYDVAMFYYAGHGIQYKGDNYLVPIDAVLSTESDVEYECSNVNRLLSKLEEADVKMKIIALDACRNNPFERSWHRGTSSGRGLSAISAPAGTFISYATGPGTVAADGEGEHSPYTAALLQTLKEKDLPIESVFKKVAAKVYTQTGRKQSPWYASSLYEGEFVFNPSN